MSSPETEAGTHSYEPVPCAIIPAEENGTSQNRAPPESVQPVSYGPNVNAALPMTVAPVSLSPATHQIFLKGKTWELAFVVIVTSIVKFLLGIIGIIFYRAFYLLISGVPFWGLLFYLTAGLMTLSVRRSPTSCLVRASLALNVLGAIVSGIGIIMAILDILLAASIKCPSYPGYRLSCGPPIGTIVVFSTILIADLLLFCVSTSIAVFGCCALSTVSAAPQIYLVQNGMVVPAPTTMFPATPVVFPQTPVSCTVLVEENNQHLP